MHTWSDTPVLWQTGKVHLHYHQSTSKWVWQVSLIWTNTCTQTDRSNGLCTPTLAHPHKNVTMSCCVFCSCWLLTVCWEEDYCIIKAPPHPTTRSDMADMTPDVSFSDIYIWKLLQIWREKRSRGHLWQLEHKPILSPTLTLCTQLYFPCHYLKFLVLSSFSFSHNLSASLIVKLPACSCALLSSPTIIFVWFLSVAQPASSSCQTIWWALVKQENWIY